MLASIAPWRVKQPVTAGRVRLGLARIFRDVDIRGLLEPEVGNIPTAKHHAARRSAESVAGWHNGSQLAMQLANMKL